MAAFAYYWILLGAFVASGAIIMIKHRVKIPEAILIWTVSCILWPAVLVVLGENN